MKGQLDYTPRKSIVDVGAMCASVVVLHIAGESADHTIAILLA